MFGSWEQDVLTILSELQAAGGDWVLEDKYLCFDYLQTSLTLFHVCNAELIPVTTPQDAVRDIQ